MGLKFIENAGGSKMFFCASCYIYLADKASCVSTSFTGMTGQAYLFKRVANVSMGPLVLRGMLTGDHYVRDVSCLSCNEKIGWMYEMAPSKDESYKEGSVILERLHIVEIDGITKNSQLEGQRPELFDVNNDLVARMRDDQRRRMLQRQEADRRQNMNNVFHFNAAGEVPAVALFDERGIAETFRFSEAEMNRTRNNVRRLNAAIRAGARGNNEDLWMLGFRADIARQFREIRDIMEGEPFRPSRAADNNLVMLFERMQRERERMQFHREGNFNHMDFEEWVAQNEAFFREHAEARDRRRRRANPEPLDEMEADAALLEQLNAPFNAEEVRQDPQTEMMLHLEGLLVINENIDQLDG